MASYDFGDLADYDFSLKAYTNTTFMLEAKVLKNNIWIDSECVCKQNINFGFEFMTEEKWNIKLNLPYLGSRYETIWFVHDRNLTPYYNAQRKLKAPNFVVFDAHFYF